MAIKISTDDYKKKFGEFGLQQIQTPPKKAGFVERTKESFKSGIDQIKQGFAGVTKPTSPLKAPGQLLRGIGDIGSGTLDAAFSPAGAALGPVLKPTLGAGINKIADHVSNIPAVQKFASSSAGERTSRIAQDVSNYANIAGTVAGSMETPKVPGVIGDVAENAGNRIGAATQGIKHVVKDVIPNKEGIINEQVIKALDLTQSDVRNISQSTGNEVGRFMADHQLIGENKASSMDLVDKFFKQNHGEVRSEIGKVTTQYKPSQVPRYVESLKAIKNKVDDVPGMQQASVEVDNLLNKKIVTLNDVQRVKELIDDHFNLYKDTGDVAQGVAKEGLANVRKDIQTFIEQEVKDNTGADIHALNNNVSTSKGILKAVENRSTAGLTKSNLKLGDFGAFGVGTSLAIPALGPLAPLGGIAAVFAKKVLESPAVQLRIAKFLDKLSDAQKLKIKADLESGKIPTEFDQFIKKGRGIGPGAMARGELARSESIKGTLPADSLITHEGAPDLARVEMYKNNLQAKQPVDRIKVIRENGGYAVEDGKHRLAAYKELGHERVPVEIVKKKIKVNNYQTPRFTKGSNGKFSGSKY